MAEQHIERVAHNYRSKCFTVNPLLSCELVVHCLHRRLAFLADNKYHKSVVSVSH